MPFPKKISRIGKPALATIPAITPMMIVALFFVEIPHQLGQLEI
jgi:hypothetical protein